MEGRVTFFQRHGRATEAVSTHGIREGLCILEGVPHVRGGCSAGGSLHEVPPGYIYKGMVEFTDSPHHQRPHIYMDGASDGDSGPVEGDLETVLVTPDGRMYTKP